MRDDAELDIGCHGCHDTPSNGRRRPLWRVANRVREEVVRLGRHTGTVQLVHGPANVDCERDEMVVLCLVRDGAMWIRSFVDHYLTLGARHIVFLDNGSTDDTIARAARCDRVTVYRTDLPFRQFEVGLRRWLARTLGHRRWALAPDVDELWEYPFADQLSLRNFLRYLNRYGYKAVVAHALDMFSDVPFAQLRSTPDDDVRERYRYYDLTDIVRTRQMYWFRNGQVRDPDIFCTFGGVRERFFGTQCLCQTRHALHFADAQSHPYRYDGHFTAGAPVADVTTVLLHYKFLGTLIEQARTNLALGNHHGGSENYRGFVDVLSSDPEFCLYTDNAAELRSVNELVEAGFLTASATYREWVETYGRARTVP